MSRKSCIQLLTTTVIQFTTVRKLTFTGSTPVGKLLMQQCAPTLKKVSLELGGNAPFIVFDDADLDSAVAGAVAGKYRNAGQTCVCVNRFIVQEGVYDAFVAKFAEKVAQLQVGNGMDEGVTQGPMINQGAIDKVKDHIEDALSKGGKLICGGQSHTLGGSFFTPTIIGNATTDMKMATGAAINSNSRIAKRNAGASFTAVQCNNIIFNI